MIELKPAHWEEILQRIRTEYVAEPSIYLIRGKMREVLGFVPRNHKQWINGDAGRGYYKNVVCLDFYNDAAETFFRLKYL